MSDWREGFHQAVGEWLDRELPKRRPYPDNGTWAKVATVVALEEEFDPGGAYSEYTPVDPSVRLTIEWVDVEGRKHAISEGFTLTALMKELTP